MQQFIGWMDGAAIRYCGHGASGGLPANMWQCGFVYDGAEYAVIRWTDSGSVSYGVGDGTYETERIGESAKPARPGQSLEITTTPVLIRYRTA